MKIEINDRDLGKFTWELPEFNEDMLTDYYKEKEACKNLGETIAPSIAYLLATLMSGVIMTPTLAPISILVINKDMKNLLSNIEKLIKCHS